MTKSKVNLETCDQEPIHLIGAVQPHGALIAVNEASLIVEYASQNTLKFVGTPCEQILGKPLADLIGPSNIEALLDLPLDPSSPELLKPWFPSFVQPNGQTLNAECLPHRNNGHIILEFLQPEPTPAPIWEDELLRRGIISELMKPGTLTELATASANMIREVTGIDRVMIYKFAEDKHGEVIAESTNRSDSFLGLHYPASDIPDPARRHFTLNVMRSIPDINGTPQSIVGMSGDVADADSAEPLDLTYAKLRAVAPVHIEYLNNMGVGASLSISLVTNGELWGLVACHHYGKRLVSSSRLRFAELLGATTSALLQSVENTNQLQKSITAEKIAFQIEQQARSGEALRSLIAERANDLMELVNAQGILLSIGGELSSFGNVPQRPLDLANLQKLMSDGVATTSHMSSIVEVDEEQKKLAAGVGLLSLSEDGQDNLFFLRSNFDQTIRWAGKPEKVETITEDGISRLSPRGSFALWREERYEQSRPFDALDRDALRILRRAFFALNSLDRERSALEAQKLAQAEEIRLRHALLDSARANSMGELATAIAHELNQPLAAVANYVGACQQELKNAGVKVPAQVTEFIDEAVTESARAGDLVRRIRNFISQGDLRTDIMDVNEAIRQGTDLALVSSELSDLKVEFIVDQAIPKIIADKVQVAQVVLNLVRNSLVAMADSEIQKLTIEVEQKPKAVAVSVIDTGYGIAEKMQAHLFEPFHGSTSQGMGIGLSLCRSIIEAHEGRIWQESQDNGAKFVFELPLIVSHHENT